MPCLAKRSKWRRKFVSQFFLSCTFPQSGLGLLNEKPEYKQRPIQPQYYLSEMTCEAMLDLSVSDSWIAIFVCVLFGTRKTRAGRREVGVCEGGASSALAPPAFNFVVEFGDDFSNSSAQSRKQQIAHHASRNQRHQDLPRDLPPQGCLLYVNNTAKLR